MGEVKAKIDSTGVVLYYAPEKRSKDGNANLLQNRTNRQPASDDAEASQTPAQKEYEYNGYIAPRTAGKIRRIVANYTHCYSLLMKGNVKAITRASTTPARTPTTPAGKKVAAMHVKSIDSSTATTISGSNPTHKVIQAKRKIVFITLTLPEQQKHTDNYIKRHLLSKFLTWLEKRGATMWIWRAEIQEKSTNNIHFHIITNQYIPKAAISDKWAEITNYYGYSAYNPDTNRPYPSTNVEGIRSEAGVATYVTKYITKKTDNPSRKVEGRCWGMSDRMRKYDSTSIDTEIISMNMEEITTDCIYIKEDKYITVIKTQTHWNIPQIKSALLSKYMTEVLAECGYNPHEVLLLFEDEPPRAHRKGK